MSVFFVTGAGTDIGKTYIACALLRAWRTTDVACAAFKPVVSGFDDDDCAASDTARLLEALGEPPTLQNIAHMSPFRFRAPLAPPLAAHAEGRALKFAEIEAASRTCIGSSQGHLLIEGAGGVMSPLTNDKTCLDLIASLNVPVLFVAGTYLGAVSHALTGLATLAMCSIKTSALILNESEQSVGLDATHAMIRPHHPDLAITLVRRNHVHDDARVLAARLAQ